MAARIQIGNSFGELTTVRRIPKDVFTTTRWECECSCGNIVTVLSSSLRGGNTRSCGCRTAEWRSFKHGLSKTSTYRIWANMIQRCENTSNPAFRHYGGRGIKVCDRWHYFANFLEDMGERPATKSIERLDNEGHYEKTNCEWLSQKAQANNQRRNIRLTLAGKTMTMTQWAEHLGCSMHKIRWRVRAGWPIERVLSD